MQPCTRKGQTKCVRWQHFRQYEPTPHPMRESVKYKASEITHDKIPSHKNPHLLLCVKASNTRPRNPKRRNFQLYGLTSQSPWRLGEGQTKETETSSLDMYFATARGPFSIGYHQNFHLLLPKSIYIYCIILSNMLSLKQNKYQYTYLNTYIALYFVRQNYLKTHTNQRKLISDPRRGCYIVSSMFIFFLFFSFFFRHFCPGHISGTVTRRDSKLSVLLGPAV